MYILLISFFLSLSGIVFMIGRKLKFVRAGEFTENDYLHPFVPHLQKIKNLTYKNIKEYGNLSLVTTLRLYIKSSNLVKEKYKELKIKIQDRLNKNKGENVGEKKEASKFLKMISDYKHKIRKIKHQIKEEENL